MTLSDLIRLSILRAPDGEGGSAAAAGAAGAAEASSGPGASAAAAGGAAAASPAASDAKPADKPADKADDPLGWLTASLKEAGIEPTEQEIKGLRDTKTLSPAAMYRRMRAAEKAVRGESIEPPPAEPEKLAEWLRRDGIRERFGVPDKVDGYEIGAPKLSEENAPYFVHSEETEKAIAAKALEMGVPKAHFAAMRDAYYQAIDAMIGADVADAAADEQRMQRELRGDWGDAYDDRMRLAVETAKTYGLDERATDLLRRGNVVGSTALARILADLGAATAEDGPLKGGAGRAGSSGGDARRTPAEWRAELEAHGAKHGAALMDRAHPEHALRLAERRNLMELAGVGVKGRGAK